MLSRHTLPRLSAMFILAALAILAPGPAPAIPLEPAKDNPIETPEGGTGDRFGLVTLPIIAYTPEATAMLGMNFMLVWNRSQAGSEEMPDLLNAFVIYTLLDQIICGLNTINYVPGVMMVKTALFYQKFPSRFYGIGPNTSLESRENFTPVDLRFRISPLFSPLSHLYMGPRYEYDLYDVQDKEPEGELSGTRVVGSNGTHVSGFGFEIVWDTKDNFFYPFRGWEVQLIVMGFHRYTGSGNVFYRTEFDLRRYIRIYGRHVLALQYFMQLTGGDVPFQLIPAMGGQNNMRGYYQGRYRDKNYFSFQAEYRFPLIWRFSGVLFGGTGIVAPAITRINFQYLRIACGGGLRFLLHQERMINLRLDFAVNNVRFRSDDYGMYFSVMEAF